MCKKCNLLQHNSFDWRVVYMFSEFEYNSAIIYSAINKWRSLESRKTLKRSWINIASIIEIQRNRIKFLLKKPIKLMLNIGKIKRYYLLLTINRQRLHSFMFMIHQPLPVLQKHLFSWSYNNIWINNENETKDIWMFIKAITI